MNNDIVVQTEVSMGMIQASSPKQMVTQATEMADELAKVITSRKLYTDIGGKRFVRVEGWTTLGAMLGCIPQEVSNERQDDGRYIATVELVRMNDGKVVSRASGECGAPGEARWGEADEYAKRSMAATRATSKAGRLAFSWIMVLAGFEATPAEEMTGRARDNVERQAGSQSGGNTSDGLVGVGKNKDKKWSELTDKSLSWYCEECNNERAKKSAIAERDRRRAAKGGEDGKTGTVESQSTEMATEGDLRLIKKSAEAQQLRMTEVLEMFELESSDQIRRVDVPFVLKWISNPGNKPDKLPAF